MKKVAGEVIFKKDRGGDVSQWAYADHNPSKREIPGDFNYSPKNQKPLARVLLSTYAALGHCLLAYNSFAKLNSARLSPDGSLGGRGYIMKIADMRKQYMNTVEALSALSDTLYDEINAPHWSLLTRQESDSDKAEVSALIQDAEKIRRDPEEWAEVSAEEEFGDEVNSEEDSEEDSEVNSEENPPETDDEGWGDKESEDEGESEPHPEDEWIWSPGFPGKGVMGKLARMSVQNVRFAGRASRVAQQWLANREPHEENS
jgi:hypothetical protein